ncbi:MAG: hypothetical protein L0219_17730, partial [Phycisphaerales bacterium]|nr:hypothetical protein [Phycisphaerales bacterium]
CVTQWGRPYAARLSGRDVIRISGKGVIRISGTRNCPHLVDLRLLARHDCLAEFLDSLVLQRPFLTHQDRTRVMGKHRSQELSIGDRRLLPDEREEHYACNETHANDESVQLLVFIHARHQ